MPSRRSPGALVTALLNRRVARFALVGAIGIPVNVGLLWLFHANMRIPTTLAWLFAFECSALLNFYANQRFTYHEQTHVRGMEWIRRALRAQISSFSGVLVNIAVFGGLLALGMTYLGADVCGIVAAFFVNFAIASRFVFTPPAPTVVSGSLTALTDTTLSPWHRHALHELAVPGGFALQFAAAPIVRSADADVVCAPDEGAA